MGLCFVNGNIITLDPNNPIVEAVAIHEDIIIAMGTSDEIKSFSDDNDLIVDLKGKSMLPGFIDSHIHLLTRGTLLHQIDLRDIKSIKEIKELVTSEINQKPSGTWIVGRGWNDNQFISDTRFPLRWDLDEVAPQHPVALIRVCGHITVVNSKALELAGITKDTPSPSGGQIDINSDNEPTGILREAASYVIRKLIKFDDNEYKLALKAACELAVSKGFTSIHCLPINSRIAHSPETKAFQTLLMQNKLPLRAYVMIPEPSLSSLIDLGIFTGFGNNKLKIGALKILLDGSFGGSTAAMLEPYDNDPDNYGILIYSIEEFQNIVNTAHRAGFQLAIHCIGDKAVKIALDAIETTLNEFPRANSRHRIEHASILNKAEIQRMRKLGVIAASQPPFIASDGAWITERIGKERSRFVYPFKSLITEGVKIAAGSDCPVESMDPLPGIQAAVSRVTTAGTVFVPEEQISVEQAIRMYTIDAAYASFEEHIKGSIELGKLADFVVLSDNPLQVPVDKIRDLEIEMTIVGGKVVYTKTT